MAKKGLFVLLILFGFTPAFTQQKVKYKDIYGLLSVNKFEEAEPFLKNYVKEVTDNPNAYLYMGIIYEDKKSKDDILKSTDQALNHMDSAIFFFDKASKMITEKELKKEKEYYVMYNKRDLRTGEFGVKLTDVQYDLEKRIEALRERIDKVKMIKYYFTQTEDLYNRSFTLFGEIQQQFPGQREFYLRADDETLAQLKALSIRFDSCTKAFDNYKVSLSNLGRSSYNQQWKLTPVEDLKKDGTTSTDFYTNDLLIWDYKSFADRSIQYIDQEIKPLRDDLLKYDIEINKLREKLKTDSVSVRSELTKLVESLLMDKLKKFDAQPLPMDVLAVKVADLEYRSLLLEGRKSKDTADVVIRLTLVKNEVTALKALDSLSGKLLSRNIEEEGLNYKHFIGNTYSNATLLRSFIRSEKEFAERELKLKEVELLKNEDALNWIVSGADSIPLVTGRSSRFNPLLIQPAYTAGVQYTDNTSCTGYFYSVTKSRVPTLGVKFPIDSSFTQVRAPMLKSKATADAGENIYFVIIYSEEKAMDNAYPASLAKIYKSDGLSWTAQVRLPFVPQEISFQPDSGDLVIRSGGEASVTVDKTGKVR